MNRFFAYRSRIAPSMLIALLSGVFPAAFAQAPAAAPARVVAIKLGDYRFEPSELTVRTGEMLQLELNNSDRLTPHNFTIKADAAGLNVDVDVGAGKTETVAVTPSAPGNFEFYCNKKLPLMKSHRDRGMHGTLHVVPAGTD